MNKIILYILISYAVNLILTAKGLYDMRKQKLSNKELMMFAIFLGLSPITLISFLANQLINLFKKINKMGCIK